MPQMKHPDFKLTTSGGRRKGRSFAEYLVGQIIAWERGFLKMHEDQKSKIWNQLNWVPCRMLDVMTIGILDNGEVSSEVKSFCKALGMKVLSFPATVEKTNIVDLNRQTQELVNILQNCDFVCNLLPNAPETRGLLSRDFFKQCKRKPVFINIGGEDITDANTILTAIRNKWISGAILDAHPGQSTKDSEFSTLPNVIFTYHASGAGNYKSVIDDFIDNFNKYVNGQQLNNLVPMHNR